LQPRVPAERTQRHRRRRGEGRRAQVLGLEHRERGELYSRHEHLEQLGDDHDPCEVTSARHGRPAAKRGGRPPSTYHQNWRTHPWHHPVNRPGTASTPTSCPPRWTRSRPIPRSRGSSSARTTAGSPAPTTGARSATFTRPTRRTTPATASSSSTRASRRF